MYKFCRAIFLSFLIILAGKELSTSLTTMKAGIVEAQVIAGPQPPRVFLDTTYIPAIGKSISVVAGGDLQTAINQANPGDEIVLQAGATYLAPLDGLILPPKNNPTGRWITIRSSNMSSLPAAGTRVGPGNAAAMPKILSQTVAGALNTKTGTGAANVAYWRIMGVEFSLTANALPDANTTSIANYGLVRLGDPGETSASNVPHDLTIDRCYIHGRPNLNSIRGIGLNSAFSSIIDSYISDFHGVGLESQAIDVWNGPGPFKIVDNELEGATENVMFGGADPAIPNLVPSDIEIRNNHFFKPLSWKANDPSFAGYHWSVKNLLELKNAQRILIQGNTFENNWPDAQDGFAVLFKSVNQGGTAPWSVSQDVEFSQNIVQHTSSAINIQGTDPDNPSGQTKRIKIDNNLFADVNSAMWSGSGIFVQVESSDNIAIDHNTVLQSGTVIVAYGNPTTNFSYSNNIAFHNTYGVKGDNAGIGSSTINAYFPGSVFAGNLLIGGDSSIYPTGNFFITNIAQVGFVDFTNGNYGLSSASHYKNAGTDGLDIGYGIGGSSNVNPPPPLAPVPLTPTPTSGTLLADDFSGSSLDQTKWAQNNLFSGLTDSSVPISVVNQQLRIGPLLQNTGGSHYNGIVSASAYNFTGGYASVQLAQSASAFTGADAMLTIGNDVNGYYRIYVEAGNLVLLKRVAGTKITLQAIPYNSVIHSFLRIRHDAVGGNVVFEAAPANGAGTGSWAQLYSEPWSSIIDVTSIWFELKAGTWQAESRVPGMVIFDKFQAGTSSGPNPPPSGSTILLADDFSAAVLDNTKWQTGNLFSGFTDPAVPLKVVNQQLQIGSLDQNKGGSHYNGITSVAAFDLTGAYVYVQLTQAVSTSTMADAMFTVGSDTNNFYRIYVEGGGLFIQRKVNGAKATLLAIPYSSTSDSFLRIRHDAATGNVSFETAPGSGAVPGSWTQLYSEKWNTGIAVSGVLFELKAGTWQVEANPPNSVVFDNFQAARP